MLGASETPQTEAARIPPPGDFDGSRGDARRGLRRVGARRLHTVLERWLEEASFTASDQPPGTSLRIDREYVRTRVGALAKNADLSKFIL